MEDPSRGNTFTELSIIGISLTRWHGKNQLIFWVETNADQSNKSFNVHGLLTPNVKAPFFDLKLAEPYISF